MAENPLAEIEFYSPGLVPGRRDPRLSPIANQPRSCWFTEKTDQVVSRVQQAISGSSGNIDGTAVLVLYNIPSRDLLGVHSKGGAENAERYLNFVSYFADGIRLATQTNPLYPPPIVILEPDALADCQNMDSIKRWTRIELIKQAHKKILWSAPCHLYIDIGNPDFITDPLAAADTLEEAGIFEGGPCKPRGFSVNVSNFYSTQKCEAYADEISAYLDGAHYVIDTSRNGNGHIHKDQWCNPPGRKLGTPPTIDTGHELCDAYLWIKNPGESDGPENGGPEAGKFWPEYALELCGE